MNNKKHFKTQQKYSKIKLIDRQTERQTDRQTDRHTSR